jgi:hypothetical protein
MPTFICTRVADGTCGWQSAPCPIMCPPICNIACQNGHQVDSNGCQLCACNPPSPACSSYADYKSCSGDMRCRWLAPGCAQPALSAQG